MIEKKYSLLLLGLLTAVSRLPLMTTEAADWYVDDWFLVEGSSSFSYPILTVEAGDSITFEWNGKHCRND